MLIHFMKGDNEMMEGQEGLLSVHKYLSAGKIVIPAAENPGCQSQIS
jgi:hypothetical protein